MTTSAHHSPDCDREFLEAFETCALPTDRFHHRDHVRVAWLYLRQGSLMEALERCVTGLRRFAAHHGKPGLYHETITWGFMLLIHERQQRCPTASWERFAEVNADLLTWRPSALDRYYRPETLQSEFARRVFVLPDAGLP